MMNYAAMSDADINRFIAGYIYPDDQNITPYTHRPDVQVFHRNGCNSMKDYCKSWAGAGPIAEENFISIDQHYNGSYKRVWDYSDKGLHEVSVLHEDLKRGVCIVFLMMKEGE